MKKSFIAIIMSLAVVFGAGFSVQAGTIAPELQAALQDLGPDAEVDVIIRLYDTVDLSAFKDKDKAVRSSKIIKALIDKSDKTQKDLLKLLKQNKVKEVVSFWIFNGIAARVPTSLVSDLAGLTSVEKVSLDAVITLPPEPALAGTTGETAIPQWNIEAIRAPELWALGFDGTGVVVATLDSGADPDHPDIGPAYRGGGNSWYDPNGEHATPYDASGHGTQALGLIVGGDAGGTAIGVAPGARWIAAKIFDDSGEASLSDIHLGFQWVIDPDGNPDIDDAPDIINNSWHLDGTLNDCNTEFAADIAALRAAEIVVVFSAGNSGPGSYTSLSPANNPGSFAVGAVDSSLNIASFSSRGPSACGGDSYPEVVAAGVNVRTTDLTFGGIFPNSYAWVSGTSFAAPHVAGAIALLLNAMDSQGVTVSQMQSAAGESAMDLGASGPDNDYGAGLLDVVAAYDWLVANAGSPQPGQLQFSTADYSVNEGGGSITVTVTRTGGSAGEVTVNYATSDDTAEMGADYTPASGTLSFLDGETSQTFTVTILDDTDYEGDEDLNLTLSNPTGGATLGNPQNAVVTIADNDPAPQPGDLQFDAAAYNVAENGGSITITVTRLNGSSGSVGVDYTTADITATAADDYESASGTLTFPDGQTSRSFTINILDDTDYEGDEDVLLSLSNPTGGATLGSPNSAVLTITDNDPPSGPEDADGDGYYSDVDCNDNDNSVYPGAPEIAHDGIDQDCNGYDLTIDITRARYLVSKDKIIVYATSDLGGQAGLKVTIDLAAGGSITKNMTWKASKNRWQKAIKDFVTKFGSQPVAVTVFGVEGSESAPIELR